MEINTAVERLAALGHETRLAIFRLLVQAGPNGVNAGQIAQTLDIALPTLSFHLAHLSRVGLIKGRQASRFIFYAADYSAMEDLLSFLTANCCQGGGECGPQAVPVTAARKHRRTTTVR